MVRYEAGRITDPDEGGIDDPETVSPERRSVTALAVVVGLVMIAVMAGLDGWLGWRYHQSHRQQLEQALYLQVGRQAALNLTTIHFDRVDEDVQRILTSATGTFRDDFQSRAQPFVDVVKQSQSTTEGSITEAGIESVEGDTANILVAVSVTTANVAAQQQPPRAWRMRITVQRDGDEAKVSNVQFVP